MSKFVELLNKNKFSLVVSLPANDYELAKAAWENGADVIKMHINVHHRASKNVFGSFEENKELFERILKDCPVPVGIVAGDGALVAETALDDLAEAGFDFVSLYVHHTPPKSLLCKDKLAVMGAIDYTYADKEIETLSSGKYADILEMSIVHPEGYGQRLCLRDILGYQKNTNMSKIPAVVPTQRFVYPSDCQILMNAGVKGIMIGAIVTGKEVESLAKTTKAFREAIDQLIK